MAKFYVVATPIGNLDDMTFRAIETLKNVDLILCEDTRTTGKLLAKYAINTKTASYHAHSKDSKKDFIFKLLAEGKDLALVSDAGTPCISDPGVLIVAQIREHFKNEVEIIPIPGASALISALSVSGIPSSEFTFLGFLPHKKGRETIFKEIADSSRTMAFYESPHRFMKTLASLEKYLDPQRSIVIGRELTKIFEQVLQGTPKEIAKYFEDNKDKMRGEFVVIVSGK
jgi:16S rRNA (cytidine1402-2'-O)-methyltransferase